MMAKLSKTQLLVLFLIGMGIPAYVAWRNVFPSFHYRFIEKVNSYHLGQDNYIAVTPRHDYPFNKISAYIKSDALDKQASCNLPVYKGFIVNAYPVSETIGNVDVLKNYLYSNQSQVPNGTLLADNQAVYVVSRGTYRPFVSPDVFQRLGYKWEMVMPFEAGLKEGLVQGNPITLDSIHPDGTILKTSDGKYFIVWEEKRLAISDADVIAKVWNTFYWVDIQSQEVTPIGNCGGQKNSRGEITCSFNPTASNKIQEGKAYLFKLEGACQGNITDASVRLSSKPFDREVLTQSLKDIKDRLYARYNK